MSRSRSLNRRHWTILSAGVAASIGVHALLFAIMKFEFQPLPERDTSIAFKPTHPVEFIAVEEEAIEVVPIVGAFTREASAQLADAGGGVADTPPVGTRAAPVASASSAAAQAVPVVETSALPAYEQLAVMDPLSNAAVDPIAFSDLPEAETRAEEDEGDDGIEVYVPGSIGKAKRQWAKGIGDGEAGEGSGSGLLIGVGRGGGHCPMPGRGRIPVSWMR